MRLSWIGKFIWYVFHSSDDEFDEPIREYVEKIMSQASGKKTTSTTSAASNAFVNEMEDELDQIYQNFITRGTFELPISSRIVYLSSNQ